MEAAKTWLFFLYWIDLLTGSVLIYFEQYLIASVVRMSLMPLLAIYLFVSLKPTHSKALKIFFFSALAFLWVSDIFKSFISPLGDPISKDPALIFSLSSYGVASLFHILALNKIRKVKFSKAVYGSLTFTAGFPLLYFLFYIIISPRNIGNFKYTWMIFIMSLVLVTAAATNILDSNSRKKLSYSYFLPAALLSILATIVTLLGRYSLFTPKLEAMSLIFYGYAQMLNINGFRKTAR